MSKRWCYSGEAVGAGQSFLIVVACTFVFVEALAGVMNTAVRVDTVLYGRL